MMKRFAAVVGSAVMLATVAGAQGVRPYRPAFDVIDYSINLDLPDTGSTIHAVATLSVLRTGTDNTLTLDLLDLTVNSVSVDGHDVKFVRHAETFVVPVGPK